MGPRVLIIVENLTLPLDRRVWQEATTLRDAGYTVSVICPVGGRYTARYECLEGIHIFRHPLPIEADGALGYALEYGTALFWETVLTAKVAFKVGFDVIQGCNPPDTIFLIAGLYKVLFGTPFVFDHHDINPELYEAKFGKRGFFHKLLLGLERMTFRTADVSIATNEPFREIALTRGRMPDDRVFIVRSIPDLSKFRRTTPNPALKNGRRHLIGYGGVMGAQDGVDLLVRAMDQIVRVEGRRDVQCAIVGRGTEVPHLKRLVGELGLEDYVTFTGYIPFEDFLAAYSTFDVGAIPDPKNTFNDKISMNKVFEYMTLGIPFVQFDLDEGRRIAGEAALYASGNDPADLGRKLLMALDDEPLRARMKAAGQKALASHVRWDIDRAELLAAYETALAGGGRRGRVPAPATRASMG
ncbi:MAG: glycosyltransferase family 4 protein [Hyphomicrobiaceae bacterium]